jgi:hypothetical protein
VIISRNLPVRGEVDGIRIRHTALIEAESVLGRRPLLKSSGLPVDRPDLPFVVHGVEPVSRLILAVEADDGRTARTKLAKSLLNSSNGRRLR